MSFMPNPGSLVRLHNGEYALVTKVDPTGKDDRVVLLGTDYAMHGMAWEIAEVIHEPEKPDLQVRRSNSEGRKLDRDPEGPTGVGA